MADTWSGDAVSLVEAFRAGERTPVEELEATWAAIDASELNAVCFEDRDAALDAARSADVSLPFGGVPVGVKELDHVEGWPDTGGSVMWADRVAAYTSTKVQRLLDAGAVLAAQTTSSEFGGLNQTWTKLHGATENPWKAGRTPGGSSGGSAAGVAGGLFPIATAGDGGGSIRIPAAFCGLVGLKSTYGRIPKGPHVTVGNLTAVPGCVSRSVRDTARWFDVSNGHDRHDPYSLPKVGGWEAGLGARSGELTGSGVIVDATLGGAVVADDTMALVDEAASFLIELAGMRRVDHPIAIPKGGAAWALSGGIGLALDVDGRWPEQADDLTPPMAAGVRIAKERLDVETMVRFERRRTEIFEAMAGLFGVADFVMAASNPDVAFAASGGIPSEFGGKPSDRGNNGALTIPSNIYGNPAISIPIGTDAAGLPVGLQVLGPHHSEPLLLELAHLIERARPWPLVAPGV